MGETRLVTESIVSPLVKATLPVGLYKTVDSSLKKSLTVGLYKAIRLLGKEIMLHRLHRAGVKRAKAYAEKRGLKLNIGCGPNRKEGWLNIDLSPGAEFSLDMRERIPLPDLSRLSRRREPLSAGMLQGTGIGWDFPRGRPRHGDDGMRVPSSGQPTRASLPGHPVILTRPRKVILPIPILQDSRRLPCIDIQRSNFTIFRIESRIKSTLVDFHKPRFF
jgi:hypothetical protein